MKNFFLVIATYLFIANSIMSQIIEVPYIGPQITVVTSGSIYYQNSEPANDDPIYGVVVLFVSNEQDGSADRAQILEGTNYYKLDPDTLVFTSNIDISSLHLFALDFEKKDNPPLMGSYNVEVNGVNYVLDTSNVVYLLPCNEVTPGTPSSLVYHKFLNKVILKQNYPNPFIQNTSIEFIVENKNHVRLNIFDSAGKLINTLIDSELESGTHSISWNGIDNNGRLLRPGNYLYQITVGNITRTKKMLILK